MPRKISGSTRVFLTLEFDDGTELEVGLRVTIEAPQPDVGWSGSCDWTVESVECLTDVGEPPKTEAEIEEKLKAVSDQIEAQALENLE